MELTARKMLPKKPGLPAPGRSRGYAKEHHEERGQRKHGREDDAEEEAGHLER